MEEKKPPGLQTQFGDLQERTATVEGEAAKIIRRLGEQDEQMRKIEVQGRIHGKQIESTVKELHENTRATQRTEAKVDKLAERSADVLELVDLAKKNARLLEWFVKRAVPVLVGLGTIIVKWEAVKAWFGA